MARWNFKETQSGNMVPLTVKVEDTLPVGTEIDYTGSTIPEGWEEVDDPNEYSTDEVRIGTYNNKPLYRKNIEVYLGSATSLAYDVGVNIDALVNNYGYCRITGSTSIKRPFPFYTIYQNNLQQFKVESYADNILNFVSSWTYSSVYLTIEYTKTSD